jgi:hypothetical protein
MIPTVQGRRHLFESGGAMSLQDRINRLQAATAGGPPFEQVMLHEDILHTSPNETPNRGVSATYVVIFESRRQAIFKPFGGQHPNACFHYGQDAMEAITHEVVAWRLAYALGPPWEQIVPAAVLRDVPDVGPGVLVNWRAGNPDLSVLTDATAQAFAAAFWDALIGQQDRHAKNFRYDAERRRLAAIDNAFAFARPGDFYHDSLFLRYRRTQHALSLTPREKEALDAFLESDDLYGLHGFLAPDRAYALVGRAETMRKNGVLPVPGAY